MLLLNLRLFAKIRHLRSLAKNLAFIAKLALIWQISYLLQIGYCWFEA